MRASIRIGHQALDPKGYLQVCVSVHIHVDVNVGVSDTRLLLQLGECGCVFFFGEWYWTVCCQKYTPWQSFRDSPAGLGAKSPLRFPVAKYHAFYEHWSQRPKKHIPPKYIAYI